MGVWIRALGLLGFGIALGFGGAHLSGGGGVQTEEVVNKTPEAPRMPMSDRELDEYQELKTQKEKYEKADELLGRVMLALVADFGLRMSAKNAAWAEKAAKGEHLPVAAGGLEAEKRAATIAQQNSREDNVRREEPPRPVVTESPKAASAAAVSRPRGYVALDRIDFKGNRGCAQQNPAWFIAGRNPNEYGIGLDAAVSGDGEMAAYVEALQPNSGGGAELNRCARVAGMPPKKVIFSAWVKAVGMKRFANLHLRAENGHSQRMNQKNTPLRGDFDWKQVSVELELPPAAEQVIYGITMDGPGKAWIKGVTVVEEGLGE